MPEKQARFLSPDGDDPISPLQIGFKVRPDDGPLLNPNGPLLMQQSEWERDRDALYQFITKKFGYDLSGPTSVISAVLIPPSGLHGAGEIHVEFATATSNAKVRFARHEFDAFLLSDYKPRNIIVPSQQRDPMSFYVNDRRAIKPSDPVFPGESMTTRRSWESAREAAIQKASVRPRGGLMPELALNNDGTFSCSCLGFRKYPVCEHIAAMFLEGRDRKDFLCKLPSWKTSHPVVIPIGMGRAMCKAHLRPLFDGNGTMTGEFSVTCELDGEQDVAIIGANEGLLPYIKYIEGKIRAHKTYAEIDSFGNPATAMALIKILCERGRNHTIETNSKNVAGLRKESVEYENFLLGTVATLWARKLCVPCRELLDGMKYDAPSL